MVLHIKQSEEKDNRRILSVIFFCTYIKKTPTALAVGVKGYAEVFTVSNILLLPIHSRYSFPVRWVWTFPSLQPAG